jgi:hypothetical protein
MAMALAANAKRPLSSFLWVNMEGFADGWNHTALILVLHGPKFDWVNGRRGRVDAGTIRTAWDIGKVGLMVLIVLEVLHYDEPYGLFPRRTDQATCSATAGPKIDKSGTKDICPVTKNSWCTCAMFFQSRRELFE